MQKNKRNVDAEYSKQLKTSLQRGVSHYPALESKEQAAVRVAKTLSGKGFEASDMNMPTKNWLKEQLKEDVKRAPVKRLVNALRKALPGVKIKEER